MRKFLLILIIPMLLTSVSYADASKGQKVYLKKLKSKCGFTGTKFAAMHTQDEWSDLYEEGEFVNEVKRICPKVKGIKEKYVKDLFDFAYEYGSDSGNVPSCG